MTGKFLTSFLWLTALLSLVLAAGCAAPNTEPLVTPTLAAQPPAAEATPAPAEPAAQTEATAAVEPTATSQPPEEESNFFLTVLHTNDVHAHQAAASDDSGGAALAAAVINQVRAASPNTLLLSAGDQFTGTLFYVMHHGMDSAALMNAMQYDAMAPGNHEFDEGDGNLALFIDALDFPVLAANVDFEASTALAGKVAPYAVLERGGESIGVIGVANPDTPTMSRPGSDLVFSEDVAQAVQVSADELAAAGVDKVIVLSHIGYNTDMELAQAVSGVDIIVGGHTHTLLGNYDSRSAGPYPAEVQNPQGKTVLVVQAGEYLQYIGKLDVEFDPQGELVDWSGNTIYLSGYITPDEEVTALVAELYAPIEALTAEVIGESAVYLEGDRAVCRFAECNLGNLITDAMRAETGV